MKIVKNQKDCELHYKALKNVLKNCCKHSPNISYNKNSCFKAKCSICGKTIESISPTELLLKWNKIFEKENEKC